MDNKTGIQIELINQYKLLLAEIPEIEAKGKTSPYTSINGNMFTMMRKDGALGIRLSKEDRDVFMKTFDAVPFENYGSMIKEYVEVPKTVFMDKKLMINYLTKSYDYTKTLKAKATTKAKKTGKKGEKKVTKKVTHDVGALYKNGQLKSEIKGDQLINYFEDGSIKARGQIINEKMEGQWIFNRKGGQLLQIGHFIDGVKNGQWIRYDSKGEVAYHVVFEKGKSVKKIY